MPPVSMLPHCADVTKLRRPQDMAEMLCRGNCPLCGCLRMSESQATPPQLPPLPRWIDHVAQRMEESPRRWLTLFAVLLAVQISHWSYDFTPPLGDATGYFLTARMTADGEINPFTHLGGLPGYPLMIAPAFLTGSRPYLAIAILQFVFAVGLMLGVYDWAKRHFPSAAVMLSGFAVINAGVWFYYRRTLKEIAFMMVLVWTANILQRLLSSSGWRRTIALSAAAAVLMLLLVSIRFSSVVLAGAFGLAMLQTAWNNPRLRSRAVLTTALMGVASVGLLAVFLLNGRYGYLLGFLDPEQGLFSQLLAGLHLRISDIGRVTVPGMLKSYSDDGAWLDINMFVYLSVFVLLVSGWWRLARERADVLLLVLPLHFLLHVVWTPGQGARFLVPMVPILAVCLWAGLKRWPVWQRPVMGMVLTAHLITATAYWGFVDAPRAMAVHRQWQAIDRVVSQVPADVEVAAGKGTPLALQLMWWVARGERMTPPEEFVPQQGRNVWMVQLKSQPQPAGAIVREEIADVIDVLQLPGEPVPQIAAPVLIDQPQRH